jgi:hypothetical protein
LVVVAAVVAVEIPYFLYLLKKVNTTTQCK